MYYQETKVYYDGSHYIAIPQSKSTKKGRRHATEPKIVVLERPPLNSTEKVEEVKQEEKQAVKEVKKATRYEIFNEIYSESLSLPKANRKEYIEKCMKPYFNRPNEMEIYIKKKTASRQKNIIARKTRFIRKAYMNDFNYFATFTYDSQKMDEETFKKKLAMCLSTFQKRKGWRYMGVWERAPKTNRLHFHCLLYAPKNSMPGNMITVRDYDTRAKKMRNTIQNTYFNDRFGRSDFEDMDASLMKMGKAMMYLLKYLEKTGEKIVYSRGLPMYFISDISEKDVLCKYGIDDKKLILQDAFICYDEGEILGTFNDSIKAKLRKTNK